jgi:uncharacterized membrane protein (DUF2068 family)
MTWTTTWCETPLDSVPRRHDRGIELIAGFKLVKAVLIFGTGLGAFKLLNPVVAERLGKWLENFALSSGWRLVQRASALVDQLTRTKIALLGSGALAYGALFAVEGVGLWFEKRWAEYLTVVATGLLIPFEGYEVVKHVTALRLIALMTNTAVVAYLIYRLRKQSPRHLDIPPE